MPEYRRFRVAGGVYFFTVVTYNREPILTNPAARAILHDVWLKVQKKHPFHVDAICLLPDHIHCIWTLAENDSDFSLRWKEIKRQFSHRYLAEVGVNNEPNDSRIKRKETTFWQRRFWEHMIRDEKDMENHLNYIHFNPVKHGLVSKPGDWEWSSFHRYVKDGAYEQDWGDQGTGLVIGTPVDFE